MDIICCKDLAFVILSLKHRDKGLAFKHLFVGQEGTPENYLFALVRSIGFSSPLHKHNFDQFRYAYKGDISIGPGKYAVEGELAYHPEGVYYGPQKDPEGERVALVLQSGGASRQGFLSYQLAQLGHFQGGKFYRNGRQDGDVAQDGYEALWERLNDRCLTYPPGLYKDPIIMSPGSYAWRPGNHPEATNEITFTKTLGVYTERETRAEMIKIMKGGEFSVTSLDAIRLLFVLSGVGEADGHHWEEESAIRVSPGKAVTLSAHQEAEILLFVLPLLS
ncbi:hypothetical protein F5884DRAFT_868382 [Xylogone sp. PMI_703]|nr:hypothetical protein F5884DRAFT_868382 [Xylogone sp. PMI_703]